jgi:hypothetical protein
MVRRKNFHRAGSEAVSVLESLEPYTGGSTALRALHDLDIQDKHHTIIPVAVLGSVGVFVNIVDGSPKIVPADSAPPVLAFPKDTAFPDQPVIPTLHELVKLVSGILDTFEAIIS